MSRPGVLPEGFGDGPHRLGEAGQGGPGRRAAHAASPSARGSSTKARSACGCSTQAASRGLSEPLGCSGMSRPTANKGSPAQQRQPDDHYYPAEQGKRRVTGHPPAVHRARSLSDPQRPQRAQDDTSDTANPHRLSDHFEQPGPARGSVSLYTDLGREQIAYGQPLLPGLGHRDIHRHRGACTVAVAGDVQLIGERPATPSPYPSVVAHLGSQFRW